MTASVLDVLNPKQREVIEHTNAAILPGTINWFVGELGPGGEREVLGLGNTFIFSFLLSEDGTYASSEAEVGDFSTGVTI